MKEQFEKNYPQISKGMRLNYSMGKQDFVSLKNYLKAELSTYSFYTLLLYAQMIVEMMDNNQNIVEIIEQNTVKIFGYDDLLDAESINENYKNKDKDLKPLTNDFKSFYNCLSAHLCIVKRTVCY